MKRYSYILGLLFITTLGISKSFGQGVADITTQLCYNWTVSAIVIDGAEVAPPALNAGDKITITADKNVNMIINGVGYAGTWSVSDNGMWMSIVLSESTATRLKIVELTDTKLTVDHVGQDNMHTILVFNHL